MTAPAGIYWRAVVLESFALNLSPQFTMQVNPHAVLQIVVTPQIGMLPPQTFALLFWPRVGAGTTSTSVAGSFNLQVTPRLGTVPSTAFKLSVTPSFGMSGGVVYPGHQINVAVQRAATR